MYPPRGEGRVTSHKLLLAAKDGDPEAFDQLLGEVLGAGYRFACAALQDQVAAEDVVQESAIIAWRRIRHVYDAASFRPWFLEIVARICRNQRRSRWHSVLRMAEPPANAPSASGIEALVDVRRAVDALPWKDRAVVLLRYYLDMSVHDTAIALGLSDDAVKSRTQRAAAKLRAELGGYK
jgi:RNA polymerase sigma-70 factor (ECF subfamily)